MATPTLSFLSGTENLGLVFKDSTQINIPFVGFGSPFGDSSGRTSFNLIGGTKTFVIQGRTGGEGWDGVTTEQKLKDFVLTMEANIDMANEQDTAVFTNTLGQTAIVDMVDWQWMRSASDPNRIIYTLIMKRTA